MTVSDRSVVAFETELKRVRDAQKKNIGAPKKLDKRVNDAGAQFEEYILCINELEENAKNRRIKWTAGNCMRWSLLSSRTTHLGGCLKCCGTKSSLKRRPTSRLCYLAKRLGRVTQRSHRSMAD